MADKKRTPIAVWVILILLFVGLLGFGTGGFGGNIQRIGTAGEKDISVAQYQSALNDQLRALEAQVGNRVTFQQAQQIGVDQAVLQQVVTTRTLDNEAASLGISVGDDRVLDEVLRNPAFQSLSGTFDRETYRNALRRVGLTEEDYETSIRDEISRTLLQGAVVGGVPTPDVYAQTLVSYLGETRNITTATITPDTLTTPVPGPTDADLQTYYDANPDRYTLPEVRDITYAWLTPNMLADQMDIDDTEVRALYDERLDQFMQPERRLVERLVFATQAAADTAMTSLDNGDTDFDTLVADRGLALSDIDLGDVGLDDLGVAGDPVFSATPSSVVGPFNTSLGPALFRVNAVLAAEETPFEDAAPDLREELAVARAMRLVQTDSETINDLIAGGATVEDLAERTDLELGSISWTADTQDDIAAYESFRTAAAAAEDGTFASLETLEDGGIFVLRLDSVTPPQLQNLDDVRATLEADWRTQAALDAALEQATDIAAKIQPLTSFESLGLTPTETQNLTRGSFVEGAPADFMEKVFAMESAQVMALQSDEGGLIVRVDRIDDADMQAPQTEGQLGQIAQSAGAGISQDLFDAFAAAVQTRTDVTLDQAAVNAVNAQMQ